MNGIRIETASRRNTKADPSLNFNDTIGRSGAHKLTTGDRSIHFQSSEASKQPAHSTPLQAFPLVWFPRISLSPTFPVFDSRVLIVLSSCATAFRKITSCEFV